MFAKPRPKKSILPPPSKKRKTTSAVEEINFDNDARQEYLTGFHKRKQQRIKNAQEEAAKRARQEKIELRKQVIRFRLRPHRTITHRSLQLRDERRREVEEHVQAVNKMLQESQAAGDIEQESDEESADEWDGFPDQPELDLIDHEEEYIDEDRYTTVTVESVAVSRDGLFKPQLPDEEEENKEKDKTEDPDQKKTASSSRDRPKKKKKKFRYESKIERQLTETKRRIKSHKRRE